MQSEFRNYVLRSKETEAPGVTTLSFSDESNAVPPFTSGQYINVYFPEAHTPEGKAYSISSAPDEQTFSITVRAIGEFSNRLSALRKGDTVRGSLPYGFFSPENSGSDLVMLASGIGISPFRSMIRHAKAHTPLRRISLFHTIRTSDDAVFRKEFRDAQGELDNFSISYFVTREKTPSLSAALKRRMTAEDVRSATADMRDAEFLICGSILFTRDMWRGLRRCGVPEDRLYTEAFFSR